MPVVVNEHALLVEGHYAGVNANGICFGCATRVEALSRPSVLCHGCRFAVRVREKVRDNPHPKGYRRKISLYCGDAGRCDIIGFNIFDSWLARTKPKR